MTAEQFRRVKDIFSAASVLAAADRSTYLDQACAGDAVLRAEVDSLLDAHERAGAFVDRPAAAYASGDSLVDIPDRWIGRRIGPYEIVALIGRGGMGAVYRARRADAEYESEVAIKLVPGGYHASFVLQRLRAERQILANLDHPNIARLIDGGATDEGLPYLVMELVAGAPLDEYCERRRLSLADRLRLFRNVCAAVSYAHQHLVVHRDLKPANILVTAEGTVKLLDFGIAKLLQPSASERAAPTVTLMQAITPGFASPEQMLGKVVTTASDVYSLGVVLYLLLTRRSPYRTALTTAEDAIREVCETEPLKPSSVVADPADARGGRIDRDLDAIVMRALRKEPEARYRSVDQLAEDIRRFQESLPVVARGDRYSYRARKFVRRHRLEIAAAALVAATLVGGIVVSVHQARLAEAQRQRAERHFASVRQLADTFMFQVHDAISDLPGSTRARELLVDTALEYLNTLAKEAGQDVDLRLDLAEAYRKVGNIQGEAYGANTGKSEAAMDSYGKSIALLEPIVAATPSNGAAQRALARSLLSRSRLLLIAGDTRGATEGSQRAVTTYEALTAGDADFEMRSELSGAYSVHAYNLDMSGAPGETVLAFGQKAIDTLEDLLRARPDDLGLQLALGKAYGTAAITLQGSDPRPDLIERALELHRKALALDERLAAARGDQNADYVRGVYADRINIAYLLYQKGDYPGSLESARATLPIVARMRKDTANAQVDRDEMAARWHLGRALLATGQVSEAATVLRQNLAALQAAGQQDDDLLMHWFQGATRQALGALHSQLASASGADAATRLREWQHAKDFYDQARQHLERVTAKVTLDRLDGQVVVDAKDGLERCNAEIAKLQPPRG